MATWILILGITLAPGYTEWLVLDSGLTAEDCQRALARKPEPRTEDGVGFAYFCDLDNVD